MSRQNFPRSGNHEKPSQSKRDNDHFHFSFQSKTSHQPSQLSHTHAHVAPAQARRHASLPHVGPSHVAAVANCCLPPSKKFVQISNLALKKRQNLDYFCLILCLLDMSRSFFNQILTILFANLCSRSLISMTTDKLPLNNDHLAHVNSGRHFWVPRVGVVHWFDCRE